MTTTVSMGDPVPVLPLRQRIAYVLEDPGLAVGWQSPAYDVGCGVVMVMPTHRLHERLFTEATAAALTGPGRTGVGPGGEVVGDAATVELEDDGGLVLACRHLAVGGVGLAPSGHVVALDPEWVLCAGCARRLLAQWVGDRRSCTGCGADGVGDRLWLVRVASPRAVGTRIEPIDVWCLLSPRCLGPVAAS